MAYLTGPAFMRESKAMRISPIINMKLPWKISPNIIPNSNGKEMQLNNVGLSSLYLGTP